MHLKDIINTDEEQDPIWVAYPDSETFQVLARPLGNRQAEYLEKSRKIEWDEPTMEKKVVFDEDLYQKLFSAQVIVDWKGLYITDLRSMVLLKGFKKLKGFKEEIACDEVSKMLLIKHSPAFFAFINRIAVDIERFNLEREEAEEKNS